MEDRMKGAAKGAGGKMKEVAGKMTDDSKMQAEARWIAQLVKLKTRSAASKTQCKNSSTHVQERPVGCARSDRTRAEDIPDACLPAATWVGVRPALVLRVSSER
jgi:uncharacterized protein YjbJ (UPF0337 family)